MKLPISKRIADRIPDRARLKQMWLPEGVPRWQRILVLTLAGGILLMTLFLLRGCKQAHDRLAAPADETPIAAPTSASQEPVTFALASDADGSITTSTRDLALPVEPSIRARALLDHLLAEYSLAGSTHPLQSGPAVDDVFLVPLPITNPASPGANTLASTASSGYGGQLAVVNLRGSFADNHPSGVEVENLTVQSILGTLHANLPQISEVRFLVDGQPRETLAGHADLSRTYTAGDTSFTPSQPVGSSR